MGLNKKFSEEKDTELLENKLAKMPIKIPGSPFWEVFKRFGRDEAISLVMNVLGTAGAEFAVNNNLLPIAHPLSRRARDIILSTTGPIIEKAGFFPAHFKEALDIYKTTPREERDGLTTYLKRAVKGGSKSLVEDILIHDPLYVSLMYGGLQIYPESPAWMLSATSFLIAVVAVSGLEVLATELLYKNYKRNLKKAGFGVESYIESRFFISSEKNPDDVLEALDKEFKLGTIKKGNYYDRYFENHLPAYSGRIPKIRLRKREREDGNGWLQTAQITYTRASEMARNEVEQYRYFPIIKDKLYFMLQQEMPETFDDIKDEKVRRIMKRAQSGDRFWDICFNRTVAYNPKNMLVSTDKVENKQRPFYVVELKTYDKIKMLKEAMRYVMLEFPVIQTTHGKLDMAMKC